MSRLAEESRVELCVMQGKNMELGMEDSGLPNLKVELSIQNNKKIILLWRSELGFFVVFIF